MNYLVNCIKSIFRRKQVKPNLSGKVVRFQYDGEPRLVEVDTADNAYITGHDLRHDGYRQYRQDRLQSGVEVLGVLNRNVKLV